ncbi:DUF1289 domain-containing protein [Caldimonas thermodepolymerans]|uniref:DUF1289 domain-containing protein n=1 Tax=Caldimonas thermodepolymerans TaxID=215580 RepID=A0AA46DFR0_9BURK|nr:DUF1289 domain-containing protein [Caldimonas thermodepolymerans]TCP08227.1 hypothetical protein EV676_103260 [Caldimonas thermodepolymerans]UZG48658.1 DUF1289 domain-containing protein [Caldimonas thermodepolymerans]
MARAASSVPSPCVSVWRMNEATGWCEGCMRTLDEIAAWSTMSDAEKWQVWKQLPRRRERCQAAAPTTDPRHRP